MRALLIAFGILSISAFSNAQEVLPTEIESIHSKYGGFEFAVMMMDRDEWDDLPLWEGYDQEAVIAVIKRHQNTPEYLAKKELRKQQRLMRSG